MRDARSPRPDRPHRRRHRRQRGQGRRVDRPRPRRGRRAGDLPRALHPRLPGRGPLPEAPLPRAPTSARSRSSPPRCRGSRPWSASPSRSPTRGDSRHAYNSIAVLADGAVQAVYRKNRLPNYAVFDEQRYFVPGAEPVTIEVGGLGVGLTICEDVWLPGPPAQAEAEAGRAADRQPLGLALPPRQGPRAGDDVRRTLARLRRLLRLLQPGRRPGRARLRRPEPRHRARRQRHRPRRPVRGGAAGLRGPRTPSPDRWPSRSPTSTRSTRRWPSACATTSARTASSTSASPSRAGSTRPWWRCSPPTRSGPERLTCVVMPSPHSSAETQQDARDIAANLGCELIEIEIEPMMDGYERALSGYLDEPERGGRRATRPNPPSPTWRRRTSRRGSAAT